MPTPIVVSPRRNQFGQLLGQLLVNKIAHKQAMDREELRIKAEQAQKGAEKKEVYEKEGRKPGPYKEGVTNPYTGNRWSSIPKPDAPIGYSAVKVNGKWELKANQSGAYKEGTIKDFKVGDKFVQYKYENGKWIPTGITADRYKPTTNVTVNTGMEKTTKASIEKSLVGSVDQLLKLESIGNDIFKPALTLEGQAKNWIYKTKDYLGMELPKEQKEFLGKARVFIEDLEQYFNTYRKEITGAQAAVKELEMLRKSVLNKKLSPTQFEYSFNRIMGVVKKDIRIKRMLLAQGFEGKEFKQKLAEIYALGGDVPESEINRRGDELAAQGLPKEAIIDRLKQEGYKSD